MVAPCTDPDVVAPSPTSPLADLNGRTVCELWDLIFKGDSMFPVIRAELAKRFPGVRFVGHEAFGNIYADHEGEVILGLPSKLREQGCDAVIAGVGG